MHHSCHLLDSPPSCLTPASCPCETFCPSAGQEEPPAMPPPPSTSHRTYRDQPPTHTVAGESHFSSLQSSLLLPLHSRSLVTHYFHSVARRCRDVPGAFFPAGVLVRPVWTAHGSLCTTQLVLATSLRKRSQDEGMEAGLTWEPCSVLHAPLCPPRPSTGQKQGRLQSLSKTF